MNRVRSGFRRLLPCTLIASLGLLASPPLLAAGGLALGQYGTIGLDTPDTYTGLRLPHARSGLDMAWSGRGSLSAFAQIERPFGASPYPSAFAATGLDDLRVTRTGLRGNFGTLALEQQWGPREPMAAHSPAFHRTLYARGPQPVDRLGRSVSWTSPRFGGWNLAAAYSDTPRGWLAPEPSERRMVGAVSYSQGGLTLSGASGGASDWNLLGRYTEGRNTWRLMLARVEGDNDPILHFGLDHRYSRALTFFAEFHQEDEGVYITSLRRGYSGVNPAIRGGRGIMTGLRYDF
jgi:hypothetical protein